MGFRGFFIFVFFLLLPLSYLLEEDLMVGAQAATMNHEASDT